MKKLVMIVLLVFVSLAMTSQTLKMLSDYYTTSEYNEEYQKEVNKKTYDVACFFEFNANFTIMYHKIGGEVDPYTMSDSQINDDTGGHSYLITSSDGNNYLMIVDKTNDQLIFGWEDYSESKVVTKFIAYHITNTWKE